MDNKRLESLDVFRGFDMMWIMGFSTIILCACKLIPGGNESIIATQLEHATWDGLTFMDLIFPTFLFVSGISYPFSYAKQLSKGMSRWSQYKKILSRAFILVLFGVLCNGILSDFDFQDTRYCSVLARIGLAWMFAAILFINSKIKTRVIVSFILLLAYFLVITLIPAPDANGASALSHDGNIAGWIDRVLLPGKLYEGNWDPEGLLGLIPATVTAMLGMFTGEFVRNDKYSGSKKALYMLASSLALVVLGLIWSIWFPINKNLWSSSFVLVAGGIALFGFDIFYYIIDVKGIHGPLAYFWKVIGMNSITIFMVTHFVSFYAISKSIFGGIASLFPESAFVLIIFIGSFILKWLFLYFLYKNKIFLKV